MNNIIRYVLLISLTTPVWATDYDIPGTPGVDYTTYTEVPETSFDCKEHGYAGFGYYAEPEIPQVYHHCQADGRQVTQLCPIGTVFDEKYMTCNWWNKVGTDEST